MTSLTLSQLSEEYQGKDGKSGLMAGTIKLYTTYEKIKNSENKKILNSQIYEYEKIINYFIEKNEQFYNKFIDKNELEKDIARYYIEHSQIHLNKLQNQCNQLIYKEQQCDNKSSRDKANWALGVTVVLSVISIILTLSPYLADKFSIYDSKENEPVEILSDSIQHLNGKIEQQNEIIEKHFSLQRNDSIANSK